MSPRAIRSQQEYLTARKTRSDIVDNTIAAMNTKGGTYELRKRLASPGLTKTTARIIVGQDHSWRLTDPRGQSRKLHFDDLKDDEARETTAIKTVNDVGIGIWEQTTDGTWTELLAPNSIGLKGRATADHAMADISLRRKLLLEPPIGKDPKLGRVIRASLLIGKLDFEEDLVLTEAVHQRQEGNGTSFQLRDGFIDGDIFESFLLLNPNGTIGGRCDISRDPIENSIFIHNVWTSPQRTGHGTFLLESIFHYLNKDPDIQEIEWDSVINSIDFYHKFLIPRVDYITQERGKHFTAYLKTLDKLSPDDIKTQEQYFNDIQERSNRVKKTLAIMDQKGGAYQLRKKIDILGTTKTTAKIMVEAGRTWLLKAPATSYSQRQFDSLWNEKAKQKILFETVYGKGVGIWKEFRDKTWAEVLPPGSVEPKKRLRTPDKKIDAAENITNTSLQKSPVRRTFTFLNPYHIHNRPAALLVMLATELGHKLHISVTIENANDKAPMTSMIGLLSMFITYSQELEVSVEGKQSVEVRTAVLDLVEKALQDWHMLEEETHERPLFHAYLQQINDIAKKFSVTTTTSDDTTTPGGIDLDPRKMDLTGTPVSSDIQTTSSTSPDIFIDLTGLTPVIGAIYPVNDLKTLLTQ